MNLHQRRTHPEYVEGCFGCKVGTIRVGTVPGGYKDTGEIAFKNDLEHSMDRYREKVKAGEQPSGITSKAQREDAYKQHLWESQEDTLRDENPPEVVSEIKKGLVNQKE